MSPLPVTPVLLNSGGAGAVTCIYYSSSALCEWHTCGTHNVCLCLLKWIAHLAGKLKQNWLEQTAELTLLNNLCSHPSFHGSVSGAPLCLFISISLLRPLMVEGERSHVPSFANKSSSFSFRSRQNINRRPCNQFTITTSPKCGTSSLNFLGFAALTTSADCVVLAGKATGQTCCRAF